MISDMGQKPQVSGAATATLNQLQRPELTIELIEPYKSIAQGASTAVEYLCKVISGEMVADDTAIELAQYLIDAALDSVIAQPPMFSLTD